MGNAPNSSKIQTYAKQYEVRPECIIVKNDKIYLKQDRMEMKMSSQILKAFSNANNFSSDAEEKK